jgi:hypothetical protein
MSANTAPIPVGAASAKAAHKKDIGKLYVLGGKMFRLSKMGTALAAAEKKVLVTGVTAGVPTNTVDTTTSAANVLVAGVVPEGQKGSDGSTGLLAGDYFLLQVSGPAKLLTVTASVAIGTGLTTSTTAGSADGVDATYAATEFGAVFATLLETSLAGTSDVLIRGLV